MSSSSFILLSEFQLPKALLILRNVQQLRILVNVQHDLANFVLFDFAYHALFDFTYY